MIGFKEIQVFLLAVMGLLTGLVGGGGRFGFLGGAAGAFAGLALGFVTGLLYSEVLEAATERLPRLEGKNALGRAVSVLVIGICAGLWAAFWMGLLIGFARIMRTS